MYPKWNMEKPENKRVLNLIEVFLRGFHDVQRHGIYFRTSLNSWHLIQTR
jgi:hypothetical protein